MLAPNWTRYSMVAQRGGEPDFASSKKGISNGETAAHRSQLPSSQAFQNVLNNVNWASTPLGPMHEWDPILSQTLRFMMVNPAPNILYWGESQTVIYNEAYVPIVGQKHPSILGKSARDAFRECWDDFDRIICEQRVNRLTVSGDASMLLIERHGFLEEAYFDWRLIPIVGENGQVKGSYGTPTDLTNDIYRRRQSDTTRKLSELTSQTVQIHHLWSNAIAGLQDNEDLPLIMIYELETGNATNGAVDEEAYRLTRSTGLTPGHSLARGRVHVRRDRAGFAPFMWQALDTGSIVVLGVDNPCLSGLVEDVLLSSYDHPPEQFAIIPLMWYDNAVGFLVVAINPYRRYDHVYQQFLERVGDILSAQYTHIKLTEEVDHRGEIARRASLSLQHSELKFSRFAGRSTAGLAMVDLKGNIIFANESWERFFSSNCSEKLNFLSSDFVHADDVSLLREWHTKVIEKKQGGTFHLRSKSPFVQDHMRSDFRTGICACYADLVGHGEVESVMFIIMDISEMKWIERELLDYSKKLEVSEGNYRRNAEHCPLGICRTDYDGNVIYGNTAWHAHYGFERGKIPHVPQPWIPYIKEEDVKSCYDFFAGHHCGPVTVEFKLKDEVFTIQEGDRVYTNDAVVLATGFSEIGEDGRAEYIDFWVTNISAQKMAAKILADKMEEAIRLKNQQERFIDMISHEIRNPLSAILHCGEEVVDAMKNGQVALEAIGQDSFSSTALVPLRQACQKQLDNALDAANTIMYCVQHQKQIVDDVLTLSKLDSELFVMSPASVEIMSLLRMAVKIFERELKVTDIDLTIVEDHSFVHHRVDWVLLDAKRFLQIVINLVSNAIKFTKKSNVRKIEIKASAHIERPTANILGGVKFVPHRYRPPEASSTLHPPPDGKTRIEAAPEVFLAFSVTDTGSGISDCQKDLLFNRFAQASPKTHIEYGGSGLGLFISRQITELLGGEIGVGGTLGVGSTFAFYIKCKKSTQPPVSTPMDQPDILPIRSPSVLENDDKYQLSAMTDLRSSTPESPLTPDSPRVLPRCVLVVEDNLINQKVLCKQLKNRNFEVQAANHGKDALKAIFAKRARESGKHAAHFDVILCDIEMPIMGGVEFTRELRRLEASGELDVRVPIIGVTANVRSGQVAEAMDAGMDGVTTKPYRMHDLIENIDRFCPARG
ncbi:hypothetical protein F5Y18DRAFT_436848 [Xylariaceae sp. FL1019]|nr:hypothetical protein F5Y18DRAFT_436848 [Xylariaceae sp. FL1019]